VTGAHQCRGSNPEEARTYAKNLCQKMFNVFEAKKQVKGQGSYFLSALPSNKKNYEQTLSRLSC